MLARERDRRDCLVSTVPQIGQDVFAYVAIALKLTGLLADVWPSHLHKKWDQSVTEPAFAI